MTDIEHLHQLILNLAARLQATEAVANAAIALAASRNKNKAEPGDQALESIFSTLLKNAASAPDQATKKELDVWMRSREQDFLKASLEKINLQLHGPVKGQNPIVN